LASREQENNSASAAGIVLHQQEFHSHCNEDVRSGDIKKGSLCPAGFLKDAVFVLT